MIHKICPAFQDLACMLEKQMTKSHHNMIGAAVLYLLDAMRSLGKKSISKSGCMRDSVVIVLVVCPRGLV